MTFPSLITNLSAAPQPGDLALEFDNRSGMVILNGRVSLRLPAAPPRGAPVWVAGTDWILYGGTYLTRAQGGAPVALPSCADTYGVQPALGSVDWECHGVLNVLRLPAQGSVSPSHAQRFKVPGAVGGRFSFDPIAGLLAISSAGTTVYSPTTGALPASFGDGATARVAWSATGALEGFTPSHLTIWQRTGSGAKHITFTTGDLQQAQWLPGGSGVLFIDRVNPRQLPPQYSVAVAGLDGSLRSLLGGVLGYVLGFSADGSLMWREEGVAPGVFTTRAAVPGAQAVPATGCGRTAVRARIMAGGRRFCSWRRTRS